MNRENNMSWTMNKLWTKHEQGINNEQVMNKKFKGHELVMNASWKIGD